MKTIWNPGKTAITINKKELIDLVSCIDYLPSCQQARSRRNEI